MIHINNMSYRWDSKSSPVIDIESWSVTSDSCFIYGASGCGKSSFLNILSGISVASNGEVSVLGENLSKLSSRKRDRFRAKNIGVIYQQFNLLPYLNGLDNILLATSLSKSNSHGVIDRVHQLLDSLKLPQSVLREKPMHLSVGQQQRLAIIRALVNQPKMILADEPTSSLDSANRDAFIEVLLQECSNNQCKLVFFSHDLGLKDNFSHSENFEQINRAARGVDYAL